MDEMDKIQAQIAALLRARNYLLNQTPSDMVAIADITEKIVDLNRRQSALTSTAAPIPQLTPGQEQALQQATQALDIAVQHSAAASQIISAATTLAHAA
jgi:hypothetical protein